MGSWMFIIWVQLSQLLHQHILDVQQLGETTATFIQTYKTTYAVANGMFHVQYLGETLATFAPTHFSM